jgi:hypothetical protein
MKIKTIPLSKLKKQYVFVCNEYINKFINKQGYDFSGWVGDDVGGVACFVEQYFFSLDDIVYDINNKCEKGLIFAWQEHNLEVGSDKAINYYSYSRGLRMAK